MNHQTSIGSLTPPVVSPQQKGGAAGPSAPTSKPWGNDPICPNCNRGKTYSCICDPFFEDDDQMPARDVCRLIAEYFPDTILGLSPKRNGDGGWKIEA